MDLEMELERVMAGMEWDEVVSTLYQVIHDQMWTPQPPLPLSPLDLNQQHQCVYPGGGCSQECISVPTFALPPVPEQFLIPVGYLYGEPVYELVPAFDGVAGPSPTVAHKPKKRKWTGNQNENGLYIKKPMNAFMIFRKEQRQKVMEEHHIKDSAAVNTVLGKMWRALPKEEQVIYYDKARVEKELHSQQHPGWSATLNYGCSKRKRSRS